MFIEALHAILCADILPTDFKSTDILPTVSLLDFFYQQTFYFVVNLFAGDKIMNTENVPLKSILSSFQSIALVCFSFI